jgi:hypothetical protein
MPPKNLAEPAFGAIAQHGVADRCGGSDDAEAFYSRFRWNDFDRFIRCGLTPQAPDGKGAAIDAAAVLPDGAEITLAPQVLLSAETHDEKS